MTPRFIPAHELAKVKIPARWQITGADLKSLRSAISHRDMELLHESLIGQAICPEYYLFCDTPEVRRILGVDKR